MLRYMTYVQKIDHTILSLRYHIIDLPGLLENNDPSAHNCLYNLSRLIWFICSLYPLPHIKPEYRSDCRGVAKIVHESYLSTRLYTYFKKMVTDCMDLGTRIVTPSFKPAFLNPKTASCTLYDLHLFD